MRIPSLSSLAPFLLGCVPVRLFIVYLATQLSSAHLKWMGAIALLPAVGFFYIYLTGSRTTGPEVFGKQIWWNDLRPIHGFLYLYFAYKAMFNQSGAYVPLLIDLGIGLAAFLAHHFDVFL